MRRLAIGVLLTIWIVVACGTAMPANTTPIRVLLIDGESAGPFHPWQVTTPILKKELVDTGLFNVTVATSPRSDGDFSNFKPEFSKFQVVVMNYDAPDWPADLRNQLEQYVNDGGGLVIYHGADNAFPGWTAFNRMIGIGGWRGRTEAAGPFWFYKDGKLISDNTPGPAGMHGARRPFQVVTRDPEHPIMKGLPHAWMHASDELYGALRGPGQNMTVLATAASDVNNRGTGRDEPMLMVVHYGKGRVFHTTLGHDGTALSCVGFITTFQRGTQWAATGRVTQKVPADFPTADSVSYRIDIAQMDPGFLATPPKTFDSIADSALATMRKKAEDLNIGGVAVVAYFEGDTLQSWSSKMMVVGRYMDEPTAAKPIGSNLLAIAYAKACEAALTLKDSGSHSRPNMTGEFGWNGSVIVRGKKGFLVAAFSGGKSNDDVNVSKSGIEFLETTGL